MQTLKLPRNQSSTFATWRTLISSIRFRHRDGRRTGTSGPNFQDEQLLKSFSQAVRTVTAISMATDYPTVPATMHSVINGYKKVPAVAVV
ncbi:hypothetical protein N7474_005002 [Penicillium riverlandense]|uniref:uncharacterized protein n=1 Tax=Penicillium riverlandense TaxID=1903569 RepID=UPI0025496458|nr:uncharacterized protein N7474_005002 [Penicillium riverlandense]KAJ5819411.1 hypothetical protein N7474_005002 [Penicillium riverlandense]